MTSNRPQASEDAVTQLLLHLFGEPAKTMHILAPQGWEKSPYYRLLHPTLEQQYQEALDWHENLKGGGQKKQPENTYFC